MLHAALTHFGAFEETVKQITPLEDLNNSDMKENEKELFTEKKGLGP